MTTTAVPTSPQGGPSLQKPRGLATAQSTTSDNSLFAALLQGSFLQPLTPGPKETLLGDSKSVSQSISAPSQRQKAALLLATAGKGAMPVETTGLHQDGRVQPGSSKGQGAVKELPERTANTALLLAQHPVDIKESSSKSHVTEVAPSGLGATKNSALKTGSTTLAQAGPLAQTGKLAQSTPKESAFRATTAPVNSTLQHGNSYVSAAGDNGQSFLPMESRATSLSTNHGAQRQAVQRVMGDASVPKPALGKAHDSVPQTTAWTAFAPVTTQPAKVASPSQPSSPTVQFGDLKSVYDITQAMIGQADGGNQQIQVQVHPQGLGNLLISVVQTPDGIAVHMQAEQMATAQWLNGQSSSLVNQLQQQGLDVAGVNVSFGSSNPQSGGSDGQQRRGRAIDGLSTSRSLGPSTAVTGMGDDRLRTTQVTSSTSWSGIGYSAWA